MIVAWFTHMVEVVVLAITIIRAEPKTGFVDAVQWSSTVIKESRIHKIDPYLVAAVMKRESGFRPHAIGNTKDYGIMQVHWFPGSPWLETLVSPHELLDPHVNIKAGIHEMAWWRKFCRFHHKDQEHDWVGHYKWGTTQGNSTYADKTKSMHQLMIQRRRSIMRGKR